jgi:DNA-binding transcriptional ArsR family regulator
VATLWGALDAEHRAAYDVGETWFRRALVAAGPDGTTRDQVGAGSLLFWDNVLSLALDGAASATAFVGELAATDPEALRVRLLGRRNLEVTRRLPPGTVEAAAAGSPAAADRLRRAAGRERPQWQRAIRELLADDPTQTRDRLVRLLRAWCAGPFATWTDTAALHLAAEVAAARALLLEADDEVAAAEALLGDVPLRADAGNRAIVLVPSLIVRPFTYLLDEQDRLGVVYPARRGPHGDAGGELHGRLIAVGRALGDEMRLQLVAMLRDREATLRELMAEAGWPRSTVRHHLEHLALAGIVTSSPSSGGTRYRLRETALADLADLLRRFLDGR